MAYRIDLTEAAGGAAGADEEDHGDGEAGTRHQGLHADVEVLGELEAAAQSAQGCADQIAMSNKLGKWAPTSPESVGEEKGS